MKNLSTLNEQLDLFLRDSTSHAFLLQGPWGVGKTHAINEWLKSVQGFKIINLSLFGISSLNDLNALAMNSEGLANKFKSFLQKLDQNVEAGAGPVTVSLPLIGIAANLLKPKHNSKERFLFILDDIERKDNRLSISEILGFADSLPKENTKVILITNSQKIKGDDKAQAFKGFKEKVIQAEYHLDKPTEEAISAVVGRNTFAALQINDRTYPTNLRTLLKLERILGHCGNPHPSIVKTIYLCLLHLDENQFGSDDYKRNLTIRERAMHSLLYSGNDASFEEAIKKRLEELKSADGFVYFIENIKLLNLLEEIEGGKLEKYVRSIINALQVCDYAAIKTIKPPVISEKKEKCNLDFWPTFYAANPKKEYNRLLSQLSEAFTSKRYDLLDLYRKTVIAVINRRHLIIGHWRGEKLEQNLLLSCQKPLANYLVFQEEDTSQTIDSLFLAGDIPDWVRDLNLSVFKECAALFNKYYRALAKKDGFDFDYWACRKRFDVLTSIFRQCHSSLDLLNVDDIFCELARGMITKLRGDLDEADWERCHDIMGAVVRFPNSSKRMKKTLELLKKTYKNPVLAYRLSILINSNMP